MPLVDNVARQTANTGGSFEFKAQLQNASPDISGSYGASRTV